jgi:hypothetical protein
MAGMVPIHRSPTWRSHGSNGDRYENGSQACPRLFTPNCGSVSVPEKGDILMKHLVVKAAIVGALLLANNSIVRADDCAKECGFAYLLATFIRSCDSGGDCYVTECWALVFDCGYNDPHNDYL